MLLSMMYSDASITFYKDDDKICPDSTELLEGRIWSFVKLDEEALAELSIPENKAYFHTLTYLKVDMPLYQTYGKHIQVKISWTEDFSLEKNL